MYVNINQKTFDGIKSVIESTSLEVSVDDLVGQILNLFISSTSEIYDSVREDNDSDEEIILNLNQNVRFLLSNSSTNSFMAFAICGYLKKPIDLSRPVSDAELNKLLEEFQGNYPPMSIIQP